MVCLVSLRSISVLSPDSFGRRKLSAKQSLAAADVFKASFAKTAYATAEHVAATAESGSKIREGMIAVRTVDGIVQNKYSNDPGSSRRGYRQNTSRKRLRKRRRQHHRGA